MADHIIKQLRDALVTRLTGLVVTGTRVHSYRVNPLQSITELPALIVRTPADSAQQDTVHPGALIERVVDVVVMCYAAGNADLDDVLDAIRNDVDQALGTPVTLAGRAVEIVYDGSEMDFGEGERNAGELQLRYHATLFHTQGVPDVPL
jgi:hypothetical protein